MVAEVIRLLSSGCGTGPAWWGPPARPCCPPPPSPRGAQTGCGGH